MGGGGAVCVWLCVCICGGGGDGVCGNMTHCSLHVLKMVMVVVVINL